MITREQVGWVRTLLVAYREATAKLAEPDPDPLGTLEMELEVEKLADELDAQLDAQEQGVDLPSEAEIDAMARAAGLDNIPF